MVNSINTSPKGILLTVTITIGPGLDTNTHVIRALHKALPDYEADELVRQVKRMNRGSRSSVTDTRSYNRRSSIATGRLSQGDAPWDNRRQSIFEMLVNLLVTYLSC